MAKSSSKSGAVSGLEFLTNAAKYEAKPVCAVFGDDTYLKSEAIAALRRQVFTGEGEDLSLSTFTGRETQLRDVLDALATIGLFGSGRRMAVINEADPFVTEYRSDLEDYVAKPIASAVLVLDVKTLPSNTKLAKAIFASGLAIDCSAPSERQIKSWIAKHAKAVHNVQLDASAVDALLELIPPELGILVQEISKLALIAGENRVVDEKMVHENVGGWRARTTWEMIDAAADGRAAVALAQLDRLIASGEKPHGLLPQMASPLRKFSTALHLYEAAEADKRRLPMREALSQAGVPPFKLNEAERQLQQIGRQRARQLTQWLLAADLAIKGHNSSDERARIELERIIVRLAKESAEQSMRNKPPSPARSGAAARS